MKFVCLILSLTFLAQSAFSQEIKVGVVDIDKVILECDAGKKMQKEMDVFLAATRALIGTYEDALDRLDEEVKAAKEGTDLTSLQRQFEDKRLDLARVREDKMEEMKTIETKGLQVIEAELIPIMEEITSTEGYHVLLNANMDPLVWFDPATDVTQKIIDKYNASHTK